MIIRRMGVTKFSVVMIAILIAAMACTTSEPGSGPENTPEQGNVATSTPGDQQVNASGTATATPTSEEAVAQATGELFLEMISPTTDELFVSESSFEFSGRTTVDALLSVNDSLLEIDEEGRFIFSMDLEEGPNVVEVVASNAFGEQYDEVILVIYEPV